MVFTPTNIVGAYIVQPEPLTDERGWFSRIYCEEQFKKIGFQGHWVQLNHSFNEKPGTFRGLHMQVGAHAEDKLVRCISGRAFDVIVDVRKGSKSFGSHFILEFSAKNKKMIFIPKGVAHGFMTCEPNTELLYHHSAPYVQGSEKCFRVDDPFFGIQLPNPIKVISDKDKQYDLVGPSFEGVAV